MGQGAESVPHEGGGDDAARGYEPKYGREFLGGSSDDGMYGVWMCR